MLSGEPDIAVVGEATSGDEASPSCAVAPAARGETVLAPSVAGRLWQHTHRPATTALSPRELDVLRLVAQGLSNADMGARLQISEATVNTHLLRTFTQTQRLRPHGRGDHRDGFGTAVVGWALQRQLAQTRTVTL